MLNKDLLGIKELTPEEITLMLDTAAGFKDVIGRDIKKVPALRGKTTVNLFFEPSTRTRTSFELAAKRLSTDVINFSVPTSSVVKGESLIDTALHCPGPRRGFHHHSAFVIRGAPSARKEPEGIRDQRRRRHQRTPYTGAP